MNYAVLVTNTFMEISRVSEITYAEFVKNYFLKNLPCLLDEKYTRNWKSRQEWICGGKPSFEFLRKSFGEATVPVADCNQVQCDSHPKLSMLFKDFIDYWEAKNNESFEDSKNWYLKDWHFCKTFPSYKAYQTPILFQSDWLNEFWDKWSEMKDDYRFVYMGPKGTWTPFHADVFRSYSWSANICGHKKWILYPPGSEKYLKDKYGNIVFDLTSPAVKDKKNFQHFDKAPPPLVVDQKEGEIIFVPSCWYHQVINMQDTISINHNWINGSGIFQTWQHLQDELQLVQHSINDCKDMDGWAEQCQVILRANCGIDFGIFLKFLKTIADARLSFLKMQFPELSSFQESTDSQTNELPASTLILKAKEHMFHSSELCIFDLEKIREVLEHFAENENVTTEMKNESCSLLCSMKRFSWNLVL